MVTFSLFDCHTELRDDGIAFSVDHAYTSIAERARSSAERSRWARARSSTGPDRFCGTTMRLFCGTSTAASPRFVRWLGQVEHSLFRCGHQYLPICVDTSSASSCSVSR